MKPDLENHANKGKVPVRLRGIFERVVGSGIWWIRYTDASGRLRREKAGTRSAAILLYRKRKQEALEGRKLPEKLRNLNRPTLREFSNRFLEAVKIRRAAKPRTVGFYAEQVKRLLEYEPLASARLNDIDEALVEAYIQHRSQEFVRHYTKEGLKTSERRLAPSTVNRGLATLRRLMRLAQEWRVIDRVPRIHLLAGEHNREFVLGYAEEHAYLEFAPQPLSDIARLILDTGLRIGEALALTWPDIHLTTNGSEWGYLKVHDGKSRNARRAVPLTRRAHGILDKRERGSRKNEYVFADSDSHVPSVSTLDHVHAKTRKALKLPGGFVLHSLRHTYLTRLGLAGADAFTIMKLAGHSSVVVSQRYVHPTPRAMQDAVESLDNMNRRSLESKAMSPARPTHSGSSSDEAELRESASGTRTGTDRQHFS